jgi:phage baseplate assembly protein W
MITYRGFSTLVNAKKYVLNDFDLAKQDLINHFNIRKGEKLMQPSFGTIIWNMLFNPLDDITKQAIQDDINKIVGYDPRISVESISVIQQTSGFLIQLSLRYITTNQTSTLALNFDANSNTLTTN